MTKFHYRITALPTPCGGWMVRYYEDLNDRGGGVYPLPTPYDHVVRDWWERADEETRRYWLALASAEHDHAAAFRAFYSEQARENARQAGEEWIRQRRASAGPTGL